MGLLDSDCLVLVVSSICLFLVYLVCLSVGYLASCFVIVVFDLLLWVG